MRLLSIRLIIVLLAVLAIAACNEKPEPLVVTIHAQDIRFDVNTLHVKVGQPVKLTYINEGLIDHAFAIDGIVAERKVRPGDSYVFTFTVKQPGTYRYVCAIPGHELAGMVGTLTVEP